MSEKAFADTVCELCGEDFSCGAKTGACWCFEMDIDAKKLAEFSAGFDKCLCPRCLARHSRNNLPPGSAIAENKKSV